MCVACQANQACYDRMAVASDVSGSAAGSHGAVTAWLMSALSFVTVCFTQSCGSCPLVRPLGMAY
jgi:hypothetical protein